jgi:DNA polymerase-3 subunit alpha
MSNFTHLHVHTEFSLLDGLPKIPALIEAVKDLQMDSLAITDHGAMYGVIEFYKRCQTAGIKPIIGCEVYLSPTSRTDKQKTDLPNSFHLTLLSQDQDGYQNLMKIVTVGHLEGFYYRPRVDKETLQKHKKGIICLSGCHHSEIAFYLKNNEEKKATNAARTYLEIFGKGNFYLEIQNLEFSKFTVNHEKQSKIYNDLARFQEEQDKINRGLVKISRELAIPLVATNDVHYLRSEDAEAQDALVCIQTNKVLADINRLRYIDYPSMYLKSPQEMADLFPQQPDAIKNSSKIAQRCNLEISLGKWFFPEFDVPEILSPARYLEKLTYRGLQEKFIKITPKIKERANYELDIIIRKRYQTYFLIMADITNFCRQNSILINTRGSAAGSLVSYALGITNINPLDYNLPFERFLNPSRPSPPDIDLDIADYRRDEVIRYITEKYGKDKVAQICTFGTMLARASIRDIGRVMGMPYSQPDRIAKMIPLGSQGFPMTIKKALDTTLELATAYNSEEETKQLLNLAQKVEGGARHASVHAAGLVIAPTRLTDFTPLQRETKGDKIITQYEMHSVEDVGLIKFDILGIRNLTILENAIFIVNNTRKTNIDVHKIPLDDAETYKLLSRGETMGVFQLSSPGMTRYLMELKPSRIEDIMAMVALFRPGPMNSIPEFIKRKHKPGLISYLDPRMKDILNTSYGVITYQDDVLLIATTIAGYSWEEADYFRRAMGKKIPEEMAKQKDKFIDGCLKNGMPSVKAQKLFQLIEPFAGYGFNKAHAASYAQVAYQTAYMKAHYPVEFMAAVLTAESENTDKIIAVVNECKRMKIPVLPPNINLSEVGFTIETDNQKKAIRFGLSAIKNVGEAAINVILKARENGPFISLLDFCQRIDGQKVNKKTIESLTRAGAMDSFGKRAAQLIALDKTRDKAQEEQRRRQNGQTSFFDNPQQKSTQNPDYELPQVEELAKEQLLSFEKELLGFYLTEHPLTPVLPTLAKHITHKIYEIKEGQLPQREVLIGGILTRVRPVITKKDGLEMAFVRIEDDTASIDAVVFPRVYQTSKNDLIKDQIVLLKGRIETREESMNLIVSETRPLSTSTFKEPPADKPKGPVNEIRIPSHVSKQTLVKINSLLKQNRGNQEVIIVLENATETPRRIRLPYKINFNKRLLKKIKECLQPNE